MLPAPSLVHNLLSILQPGDLPTSNTTLQYCSLPRVDGDVFRGVHDGGTLLPWVTHLEIEGVGVTHLEMGNERIISGLHVTSIESWGMCDCV